MVQKASLQWLVWHRVSQGHQSHSWVFTVGRIKVLVLRLTLKDVGFTLGWWLWLSRLGPKWVDASHTQTLHCAHLHNLPVALSVRIRFYDYIITIVWMQVVFISWVECLINMSALNTVSSGLLCKRYFYLSCKEEVSTSFGTLLSVVHPSTWPQLGDRRVPQASVCLWGHQQWENPPRRSENKLLTAEVATWDCLSKEAAFLLW